MQRGLLAREEKGRDSLPGVEEARRAANRLAVLVQAGAARADGWETKHRPTSAAELLRRAEAMPDRHRARCLPVAAHVDRRAANPFESVLRAVALDVDGLDVEPQAWVHEVGRPDLLDRRLRLVIEADSFEFATVVA